MKEWQIRQDIFHKFFQQQDLGDSLDKETIIEEFDTQMIVQRALEYPLKQTKDLYYPGKSYAVAITFAKLLEKYFNEDFYEALDDKMLLYGNDPHFKTYSEDKEIYDQIIKNFPFQLLDQGSEIACENYKKTYQYFLKEFLLHEDTKFLFSA